VGAEALDLLMAADYLELGRDAIIMRPPSV